MLFSNVRTWRLCCRCFFGKVGKRILRHIYYLFHRCLRPCHVRLHRLFRMVHSGLPLLPISQHTNSRFWKIIIFVILLFLFFVIWSTNRTFRWAMGKHAHLGGSTRRNDNCVSKTAGKGEYPRDARTLRRDIFENSEFSKIQRFRGWHLRKRRIYGGYWMVYWGISWYSYFSPPLCAKKPMTRGIDHVSLEFTYCQNKSQTHNK